MGEMKRANAREAEERQRDRFASTIVIAAAVIFAVRTAREIITGLTQDEKVPGSGYALESGQEIR
jgi:hypothetical protein